MTDRELLEAAARNVGIVIRGWNRIEYAYIGTGILWNPLKDSDDALNLQIKFKLLVDVQAKQTQVIGHGQDVTEPHKRDAKAATRRAIVRVVACDQ